MCKNYTRIEELPSGKRVFYVDIGNIPPSDAGEYMAKLRESVKDDDKFAYIVPIRATKCTCKSTFDTEQWFMITTAFFCILPYLVLLFI